MPWLMRTFISSRFMQDDVKIIACLPFFTIDRKVKGIRFEKGLWIGTGFAAYFNTTVQNHVSAQFATAESLMLKNLFQCHFHNGIVKEFRHKNAKIVFMSLYVPKAIKNPTMKRGFQGLIQSEITRIECWKPVCLLGLE